MMTFILAITWLVSAASWGQFHPATYPAVRSAVAFHFTEPDLAIDTSGFRDGAHHWRRIRDATRVIQVLPKQPEYAPHQVREIAANILLFQRANGGWPKDYDMLAVLTDEQKAVLRATHDRTDTSFDNHNSHSQAEYLARAYAALGDENWRDACLRGFDFLLAAQLPSGGFPQRFPNAKGYAANITFNDGVMIGIVDVLQDAAEGAPHWKWLDAARQENAKQSVARAVDCILKCQIRVGGESTGWCQQHDPATFEAASARTFELASGCPQDTTEIVRFLMRQSPPTPEIAAAIDAAVAWLRKTRLNGIVVKSIPAPVENFPRHRANFDIVVEALPSAPPIWARHYEIGTDKPIFASRDGVKKYALSDIDRERRTGSAWYGAWPQALLEVEYPKWRK